MNWHARLAAMRAARISECAGDPLTKPTKVPFVSFVSPSDGPSEEIAHAEVDRLRAHLLAIAATEGLPLATIHALPDADVAACTPCDDDTLRAYLRVLERGRAMDAGTAPEGYTKAVHCVGCGPVLLWPECPDHVTACPWCLRRLAGNPVPRPEGACRHRACGRIQ